MPSRKKWICKQAAVNEAVSILPSFNLGTYSLLLGFWEKSSKLFLLYLVTLVEYFSYHISQKTGLPPPCIRYDIYTGVGKRYGGQKSLFPSGVQRQSFAKDWISLFTKLKLLYKMHKMRVQKLWSGQRQHCPLPWPLHSIHYWERQIFEFGVNGAFSAVSRQLSDSQQSYV